MPEQYKSTNLTINNFINAIGADTSIKIGEQVLTIMSALAFEQTLCKPKNKSPNDEEHQQARLKFLVNAAASAGNKIPKPFDKLLSA